jgi:hypothetical protein
VIERTKLRQWVKELEKARRADDLSRAVDEKPERRLRRMLTALRTVSKEMREAEEREDRIS